MLRSPEEGHDMERVRQFLALAAEFMGLATDDKAAQIVRPAGGGRLEACRHLRFRPVKPAGRCANPRR